MTETIINDASNYDPNMIEEAHFISKGVYCVLKSKKSITSNSKIKIDSEEPPAPEEPPSILSDPVFTEIPTEPSTTRRLIQSNSKIEIN